jgi:hypothetical protein
MPPKKKVVEESKDELIDFYKHIPKDYLKKQHNPNYEKHKFTVPFFGLIVGSTGSGKTQTLMNIIKKMNGTFSKIVLCLKSSDEPLYRWLINKLDPEQLKVYEGGEVPPVDDFNSASGNTLIVFDDLVNMKQQGPIEEFYIRGRKRGCSMLYLTQSFYKVPKVIRIQCNHILLKRLTTLRDLNMVISEYGLTGLKKQIIKTYKEITAESKVPFMCIRTDGEPEERFSKNFLTFLKLSDE